MTTNAELIARLRKAARNDSMFGDEVREHTSEQAADVIEALESKDLQWQRMADKAKGLIDELLIQRTVLQAEVARLNGEITLRQNQFERAIDQRDALQAQLAAARGQSGQYLKEIYAYLESIAPEGIAAEAFRNVPDSVLANSVRDSITGSRTSMGENSGAIPGHAEQAGSVAGTNGQAVAAAIPQQAQGQIPRDDISLELLERLSKTLTRLGYTTPEGGMEHFNAVLPHQLYNLCRGIDGVLDKLTAPIPQQVAEPVNAMLVEALGMWQTLANGSAETSTIVDGVKTQTMAQYTTYLDRLEAVKKSTEVALAAAKQAQPECNCTLREKAVGDGCAVCNPTLAAELSQPEPLITYRHKDGATRFEQYAKDPLPDWAVDVQPVKQAQPERAPLTQEQIEDVCVEVHLKRDFITNLEKFVAIARAIEQAHGIRKGGQHD